MAPRLEALEERTVLDTVTWVGGSGDWNTIANWSTGSLPGPQDDAVIDLSGITVTHSTGTHRINSLVASGGTFLLSGGTLDVATTVRGNSSIQLGNGRLANATLAAGTTLIAMSGRGAVERLTVAAGATFNASSETDVYDGIVVDGTINLGRSLYLRGTQSLQGNGRVVFGGAGGSIQQTETAGTLTFGPNLTIQIRRGNIGSAGSLLNQASILSLGPDPYTFSVGATQPWTNAGTIRVEGIPTGTGAQVYGTWTNTGEISVTDSAAHGTYLHLRGNYWTNRGTIRVTSANLVLDGTFRPSAIGDLVRSGGRVSLWGTVDVRGETLELNARTGSWEEGGSGCTVLGGTVVLRDGARLNTWNCTLDGVTFNSDADWADGIGLHVRNGLTVNGRLLLATSSYTGTLFFEGNQTLTVTGGVLFGGGTGNAFETVGPSVLTIAPNTTIRGRTAEFRGFSLNNQGTIMSDAPGGSFTINSRSFTNTGTLGAEAGGSLTLAGNWQTSTPLQLSGSGRFALDGTWNYTFPLTVTSGTLTLAGDWRIAEPLTLRDVTATISSTTGSWRMPNLTTVNSTLNLGDGFHPDNVSSFNRTGGTVNLVGTMNNAGQELLLNAATGTWNLRGARILGGTVRTTGGARLDATDHYSTLDGITLEGELGMLTSNPHVIIRNGMTLNGTIFPGNLHFDGTQTITSTRAGTILGGNLETDSSLGTLTFAPTITVRGSGRIISSSYTFINQGTIHANVPDRFFTIDVRNWSSPGTLRATNGGRLYLTGTYTLTTPLSVESGGQLILAGRWTNQTTITATGSMVWLGENAPWSNRGTIAVKNCIVVLRGNVATDDLGTITRAGGTVELAGSLDNTGRTLSLDEGTGPWLFSGTILGGTVATRGAALVPTRGGRLVSGVTVNGELDLSRSANAQLTVFGGLTLNGIIRLGNDSGTVAASLDFSQIQTLGTQTGGSIIFGGGLNRLSASGGSSARLTLSSGIVVLGKSGTLNGDIENQGTIQANTAGGTITISSTRWTNSGILHALNGGQLVAQNPPTNYASGTLTGGAWIVSAKSTLRVTGADIVTNAATILLDGPDSNFYRALPQTDALRNFADNAAAGTFAVLNGRTFTTAGPLSNAGTLGVGLGSGSVLTVPSNYVQTGGITLLLDGTLATPLFDLRGGSLAAWEGTARGNVRNAGTIDVGLAGLAGRLTIDGAYEQTATGVLELEIGAVGWHDELIVTGAATLGGTLNVRLLAGYFVSEGDSFTPLTFASRTGQFADVNLPDPGSGLAFALSLDDTALRLLVTRL